MRIIKLSYSNEEAYLRNYLRGGVDIYDYAHLFKDFLEACEGDEGSSMRGWIDGLPNLGEGGSVSELESYELFDSWEGVKTEAQVKEFLGWLSENASSDENPYDSPAYETMQFRKVFQPGWLVHFTDDARDIANQGFKYGHPDFHGLHLTTYKRDRKKESGYNFAFDASNRRDISNAAHEGRYGKEFVVFWSSGVESRHSGDEEYQVVFWGPSVNLDMVFPVERSGGSWVVYDSSNYRVAHSEGDALKMIEWVISNWRMVQSVVKR